MHFLEIFQSFQPVYSLFLQFFFIFDLLCIGHLPGNRFLQTGFYSTQLSPIYENPLRLHNRIQNHSKKNHSLFMKFPAFERLRLNFSNFFCICPIFLWPPVFPNSFFDYLKIGFT
jgi:hypothetical protein